jgi:hypothetical protein
MEAAVRFRHKMPTAQGALVVVFLRHNPFRQFVFSLCGAV